MIMDTSAKIVGRVIKTKMFSFMRPCGAAAAGGVTTYRIFFIIYQKNNYKCGAFGRTFIIIFLINYEKYSLGWHSCKSVNESFAITGISSEVAKLMLGNTLSLAILQECQPREYFS